MPSTAAPAPAMPASSWPPPYLLYLGNARDHLAAKTARGLAYWRPQWCVGQFRGSDCKTTLGLPDLDFAQAVEAGANTMIVGVANAGGVMDDEAVQHVVAALDAGRSEEHTSELSSLMRISYAVFWLKKKKKNI